MNRIIVGIVVIISLLLGLFILGMSPNGTALDSDTAKTSCIQHESQDAFQVPENGNPIVKVNQTSNQTVIRYSFNGTGGNPMFGLSIPEGTQIINSSGFEIHGNSIERKYNTESPWIELALGSPYQNVKYSTAEKNVVVPLPEGDEVDLFFQPLPNGYAGAHFALLGNYTSELAHTGCQRIQLVVPEKADLSRSPEEYAEAIAKAGHDFAIGPRYRLVTVFVAPKDTGKRNGYTPRRFENGKPAAEIYISPEAQLTSPQNTWIHEYIHTRQMTLHPRWMSEGSATFFAAQISVEEGWISSRQYDNFLADNSAPNGSPNPSNEVMAEYIHGAFFFTQIEKDLRGTNRTVEDVYRKLNVRVSKHEGAEQIEAKDFENVVNSKTNTSVNYTDPMDNPVQVAYMNGPNWLPLTIRKIMPFLVKIILVISLLGGGYLIWENFDDILED